MFNTKIMVLDELDGEGVLSVANFSLQLCVGSLQLFNTDFVFL